MKNTVLYFVLTLALLNISIEKSFCQIQIPIDTATREVSYTEIVYVDSIPKKELFGRVVEWTAISYKSANAVIQVKDEDRGKVIIKGIFPVYSLGVEISVYHTIIIDVKDGKCKIQITDLYQKYYQKGSAYITGFWVEDKINESLIKKVMSQKRPIYRDEQIIFLQKINSEIHSTLDSFSNFLQKPSPKNDDW